MIYIVISTYHETKGHQERCELHNADISDVDI